ncbi:MAG TPA: hypothetical protein PKH33_16135 [bacterium]|nr:hypothetical protein [bacterium]
MSRNISIALGVVITVAVSVVFFMKTPLEDHVVFDIAEIMPIVLGVVVACNIAKEKRFVAAIYVALYSNIALFILSMVFELIDNAIFMMSELIRYAVNISVAAILGYGYSLKENKKN